MSDPPKRDPNPLEADDERLLGAVAESPATARESPTDALRLHQLVAAGYLVRDPNPAALFRLTIRGWEVVRRVAPKPAVNPRRRSGTTRHTVTDVAVSR
jgi:hypothetical protein